MVLLVTLALAVMVVGVCFFAIGVRIIFHRSHEFPETSAGHNPNLRRMGIMCPKVEDAKLHNTTCSTCYADARGPKEGDGEK